MQMHSLFSISREKSTRFDHEFAHLHSVWRSANIFGGRKNLRVKEIVVRNWYLNLLHNAQDLGEKCKGAVD